MSSASTWLTAPVNGSPKLVKRIREVSAEVQRHVAVMMDVKGPEIRTGVVAEPIDLKVGDTFEFYTKTPSDGMPRRQRQLPRPAR